jgi:hypothetical protein
MTYLLRELQERKAVKEEVLYQDNGRAQRMTSGSCLLGEQSTRSLHLHQQHDIAPSVTMTPFRLEICIDSLTSALA